MCIVVLIPSLVCTTAAIGYACTFSWDVARMFFLCLFIFFKLEKANESLHCKHYLVLTFLCKVFILCFQKNSWFSISLLRNIPETQNFLCFHWRTLWFLSKLGWPCTTWNSCIQNLFMCSSPKTSLVWYTRDDIFRLNSLMLCLCVAGECGVCVESCIFLKMSLELNEKSKSQQNGL